MQSGHAHSSASRAPIGGLHAGGMGQGLPNGQRVFAVHWMNSFTKSISNDHNFRLKHPGVPDGSDGTSYAVTENYTLPVAQATARVAYVPPLLCGGVYASSERHVCYTLRRGCSYAEAVYTTPGNRRQAWEHLGAPATCLGAPRITVMYSVCILIYVSMYLYSYPSTHAISGLAAVCRIYTPRHPVHLRYPCISGQPPSLLDDRLDRACLRCTWRQRLSELRDAPGGLDQQV